MAIGVGIFFLAGGIRRDPHPNIRAAIIAGLLTGTSIATYTVWDKYAVSVIYVSPILLDLLANPLQALLLMPWSGTDAQPYQLIGSKAGPSFSASLF